MIVKQLRNKHNWSQDQLATLCGLGIRTIQRIESGQSASLETLKSLSSVFEVDIFTLTEVITVIDKQSEKWRNQPWWFRAWAWGVATRKIQIWIEGLLLTFGIFLCIGSVFVPEFTYLALFFMFILYIHSLFIRYGDNNQVWGYAT